MSNETLNSATKKTRLVHSKRAFFFFSVLVVGVVLVIVLLFVSQSRKADSPAANVSTVSFGDAVLQTEVVADEASRQRGLSGRERLADDASMLFVFEQSGIECFWMKDMQFAIDMIWLDEARRVTHIAQAVSPETYPQSFCPETDSLYVLEVAAGIAKKIGLHQGAKLEFNL